MVEILWVIFLGDGAISVEIQWLEGGRQCLGQPKSLTGVHFKALGKREAHVDPVLAPKMIG